jgi:SAM-dependent methyltransferase
MYIFSDRRFRLPRIWSNKELAKFAPLYSGDIVNVSGWKDIDKEGKRYKDYFINASSYSITNYKTEARGFQGFEDEIFLDLEEDLPENLLQKFDVVFNHTVLEHVFEAEKAFTNLCRMSKDTVIIVLPFLQEMHTDYGDFWRFSPLCVKRLFEKNQFNLQYLSFNSHRNSAIYVFAIGTKYPDKWASEIPCSFSYAENNPRNSSFEKYIGVNSVNNWKYEWFGKYIQKFFRR